MSHPPAFGGRFGGLQWIQAKVVLVVGWQLFCRPQDFSELDLCDVVVDADGMTITIRYAKNDTKGLTRSPRIARAGGRFRPVELWERYVKALGLVKHAACDKVLGEPTRCSFCGPAFPAVWKLQGVKQTRMPAQQASKRIKQLFAGLASAGLMTEETATSFSGKSCRCGGVSAAAGEAVRGGVLQGHGGWLARESLRHYDLMRDVEKSHVSLALSSAVTRLE